MKTLLACTFTALIVFLALKVSQNQEKTTSINKTKEVITSTQTALKPRNKVVPKWQDTSDIPDVVLQRMAKHELSMDGSLGFKID